MDWHSLSVDDRGSLVSSLYDVGKCGPEPPGSVRQLFARDTRARATRYRQVQPVGLSMALVIGALATSTDCCGHLADQPTQMKTNLVPGRCPCPWKT